MAEQVGMNERRYRTMPAIAVMLMALSLPALLFAVADLSPGLLHYIHSRWGDDGEKRVQDWHQYMNTQKSLLGSSAETRQRASEVLLSNNAYWNHIPYFSDKQHWGVDDYWATPIEMQGSNGGDCEDYSIGKYFTLKDLGVPIQKLRIVYVRALSRNEPHMVLAYYPEPDAEPFILDNLNSEILPASKRTDLDPVFSFNDDDLWAEESQYKTGKSSQIRLWRELLEKMDKEQKL